MELRDITIDDLPLYERIHCDPAMMEHLGGALPRDGLAEKLRRDAASTEAGESRVFAIVPGDDADAVAGTVCIWEHAWQGQPINEIGWMVLPAYQGRRLGSEAVRSILRKARSESRWDEVHAFPPIANLRSNAMCRKMGFANLGACDVEFRDRLLRCRHWRLDLRSTPPA